MEIAWKIKKWPILRKDVDRLAVKWYLSRDVYFRILFFSGALQSRAIFRTLPLWYVIISEYSCIWPGKIMVLLSGLCWWCWQINIRVWWKQDPLNPGYSLFINVYQDEYAQSIYSTVPHNFISNRDLMLQNRQCFPMRRGTAAPVQTATLTDFPTKHNMNTARPQLGSIYWPILTRWINLGSGMCACSHSEKSLDYIPASCVRNWAKHTDTIPQEWRHEY
jgi:hypothetical protein